MSDNPKVSINDKIHSTVVWVEPAGYNIAKQDIEALGATCHDEPGVPGFCVIIVKNELRKSIDKNNIKPTLQNSESLEYIDFTEAMRLSAQKRTAQ